MDGGLIRAMPHFSDDSAVPPSDRDPPSSSGAPGNTSRGDGSELRYRILERFPALRHRNFRWFLGGQIFSVIGGWMQQAALLWYVQTLTRDIGSEYWLGVTAAMAALPIILFSPLGGTLADRFNRRWLIVATQSAAMLASFLFGFLVAIDRAPLGAVLAFAAFHGIVLAHDIPARQAFAIEMVGRRDLLSGIALNSAVFNVGRLLGPMAAGWVIATLGIANCFLLNGASFIGVIAALVLMKLPPRSREDEKDHAHGGIWRGFQAMYADKRLLGMLAVLAFVLLTGGAYLTLLPALAQNVHGLDSTGYSLLLTANGLGSLIGALAVGGMRDLQARRGTMVLGIVMLGLGLCALSVAGSKWTGCLALLVAGGGFVGFLASTNSMVQLSVSDAIRGRVMSIWVLIFGACQPLGSYLAGAVAFHVGTQTTLLFEGLACLLAAAMVFFVIRSRIQATFAPD